MSLTNFESAIKGNMDAYSGTLKALRDNEVMQRNSALAEISLVAKLVEFKKH